METLVLNSKEYSFHNDIKEYQAENGLFYSISEDEQFVKVRKAISEGEDVIDLFIPNEVIIDDKTYPVREISLNSLGFGGKHKLGKVSFPANLKNAEFDASKIETLYINGCRDLKLRYVVSNKVYYDTLETLLSINKGTDSEQIFIAGEDLVDLIIPEGVTTLPERFVSKCKGLRSLTLPSSLKEIPYNAFGNCSNLASVTLPEGLETIGTWAFIDCESLKEVILPSTIKTIGAFALQHTDIEKIVIPDNVEKMEDGVFQFCFRLKEVKLPNSLQVIDRKMFMCCESLTEIVLPQSLTSIKEFAFAFTALKKITIPANVKEIESYIFERCKMLTDVYCEIIDPTQCNVKTLDGQGWSMQWNEYRWESSKEVFYNNATLHLSNVKGIVSAYKKKAAWKKFANIVADL